MSASYENSCAPETRSLIASRLSTENRHFWLHLTQDVRPKNIFVHWLLPDDLTYIYGGLMSCCNTENFNYFWICEPLARCAKRGSSLPLGTPMEIDFTSAYLHYPLPQCSKIVTPIIFSISYELFRLPSAKVPQDYQLLRTFVWCIMEKLTGNNGPFLDTRWQLIQSIKAMLIA